MKPIPQKPRISIAHDFNNQSQGQVRRTTGLNFPPVQVICRPQGCFAVLVSRTPANVRLIRSRQVRPFGTGVTYRLAGRDAKEGSNNKKYTSADHVRS
jgi:hypothetical protein